MKLILIKRLSVYSFPPELYLGVNEMYCTPLNSAVSQPARICFIRDFIQCLCPLEDRGGPSTGFCGGHGPALLSFSCEKFLNTVACYRNYYRLRGVIDYRLRGVIDYRLRGVMALRPPLDPPMLEDLKSGCWWDCKNVL